MKQMQLKAESHLHDAPVIYKPLSWLLFGAEQVQCSDPSDTHKHTDSSYKSRSWNSSSAAG